MAEARARLKRLKSNAARGQDPFWDADIDLYGFPGARLPEHVYRVLCGWIFPATGSLAPCPQTLGIAAVGWSEPEALTTQAAVVRADDGDGDGGDSGNGDELPAPWEWLLLGYRGHYHRDADGTYRLISAKAPPAAGRRRSKLPRYRLLETGSWPVGRRPLPAPLRDELEALNRDLGPDGARAVIGHHPVLPARVRCPRCRQINLVEPPDGEVVWPPERLPEDDTEETLY